MNLAYKKILGKFTKVFGFGKTPPPMLGKIPNVPFGYLSRENWDLIKAMGKCRPWVNVAMGICCMGICRMGICRLTVRKQVLTTCRVLNELTVREGGGVVLLPRSPSGARRRPCPLGLPPWCRWKVVHSFKCLHFQNYRTFIEFHLYKILTLVSSPPSKTSSRTRWELRSPSTSSARSSLMHNVWTRRCGKSWDAKRLCDNLHLSARARGGRYAQVGLS